MAEQRRRAGKGQAGKHRRIRSPLLERREHTHARERSSSFPAPTPSALVGLAVLVLIGFGVIHLSSTGSAVPLEQQTPPGEEQAAGGDVSAEEDGAAPSTLPGGSDPAAADEAEDAEPGSAEPTELVVHVSGAVGQPSVVRLPAGARVDDAVLAAGGATDEADLESVNLAQPLVDGEQIHVPVPGEDPPPPAAPHAPDDAGGVDGPGGVPDGAGGAVDLNTASASQLQDLPGIGPAIAQRIIDHREQNGPFHSVDGLLEVSGIGPATLEKIRDQATVSP